MSDLFTKIDIERLVRLFAAKLHEAGVEGTIKIVGGAAIALLYFADRRSTSDIDALYPADNRVVEIIHQVGTEEGLSDGWINNIEKLIQICELTTIQEIEEIFERYFPDLILKAETREVVERMLENREKDRQ